MSKPIFQDIFSTTGRRNRKSYALVNLLFLLAQLPVQIFLSLLEVSPTSADNDSSYLLSVLVTVCFVLAFAQFTTAAQRCRDIGKSGWMSLVLLIPFINIAFFAYLLFARGDEGPNKFGPDPLKKNEAVAVNLPKGRNNDPAPHTIRKAHVSQAKKEHLDSKHTENIRHNRAPNIQTKTHQRAWLVIEYDPNGAKAYEKIKSLPQQYAADFFASLENDPKQDAIILADTLIESYNRILQPYEDHEANFALKEARKMGVEAEEEFRKVYELLEGKVAPMDLIKKIELKFKITPQSAKPEEQNEKTPTNWNEFERVRWSQIGRMGGNGAPSDYRGNMETRKLDAVLEEQKEWEVRQRIKKL